MQQMQRGMRAFGGGGGSPGLQAGLQLAEQGYYAQQQQQQGYGASQQQGYSQQQEQQQMQLLQQQKQQQQQLGYGQQMGQGHALSVPPSHPPP
eukprot:CAMPEP_0179880660 /NCGR_PEP_ID=MMETSP0982-20121206/26940_1 /TAXON_ID=483367 /ORGANISM="non described non described, Strain CCMP 2436" /LENGTH=92 /DNA_ID=CAMNT_0021774337 /DNA_START=15 /DNA_END=293 /DNA_ORIENTATION=-